MYSCTVSTLSVSIVMSERREKKQQKSALAAFGRRRSSNDSRRISILSVLHYVRTYVQYLHRDGTCLIRQLLSSLFLLFPLK